MNTTNNEVLDRKQELLKKKRLPKIVSDWVTRNKKVFWKYEVSSFYRTYILRICNLPEPSVNDILLSGNNSLLSVQQKQQLCDAVTKVCSSSKTFTDSSIDVQIDYDNGIVIAEVL
ncbi:MAG TPA: hypothetical protein PLY36_15770 [Spirochaetota bacterium]|nr:hypothetical protein [Spirochaetota bacterium]